jgi:hypothetical protein
MSPLSDSSGRDPHSARTNRRRSRIDRGPLGGQASMAANGDSDALMVYPSGKKRLLSTGMVVFLVVSAAAPLTAMAGNMPIGLSFSAGLGMPMAFVVVAAILACGWLRRTQPRGERDRRFLHLYRAGLRQARRRRRRLLRRARLRGHVGRARSGLRLFRLGPVRPARPQRFVDSLCGRGPRNHRDHGLSRARFFGARARLLHDGRVPRARGIRPLGARSEGVGVLPDGGLAARELRPLGFRRDPAFRGHVLHRH